MDREQIDMLLMLEDGDDSTALVRELFGLFEGESRQKLEALDQVCQANDVVELRQILHFVAGSAGNLGMARLSMYYRAIEKAIDAGMLTEIDSGTDQIRAEFESASAAFKAEFSL